MSVNHATALACDKCKEVFPAGLEFVFEPTSGKRYHANCFRCVSCDIVLKSDYNPEGPNNPDGPKCLECTLPTCHQCRHFILGKIAIAEAPPIREGEKGEKLKFHTQCLRCINCKATIRDSYKCGHSSTGEEGFLCRECGNPQCGQCREMIPGGSSYFVRTSDNVVFCEVCHSFYRRSYRNYTPTLFAHSVVENTVRGFSQVLIDEGFSHKSKEISSGNGISRSSATPNSNRQIDADSKLDIGRGTQSASLAQNRSPPALSPHGGSSSSNRNQDGIGRSSSSSKKIPPCGVSGVVPQLTPPRQSCLSVDSFIGGVPQRPARRIFETPKRISTMQDSENLKTNCSNATNVPNIPNSKNSIQQSSTGIQGSVPMDASLNLKGRNTKSENDMNTPASRPTGNFGTPIDTPQLRRTTQGSTSRTDVERNTEGGGSIEGGRSTFAASPALNPTNEKKSILHRTPSLNGTTLASTNSSATLPSNNRPQSSTTIFDHVQNPRTTKQVEQGKVLDSITTANPTHRVIRQQAGPPARGFVYTTSVPQGTVAPQNPAGHVRPYQQSIYQPTESSRVVHEYRPGYVVHEYPMPNGQRATNPVHHVPAVPHSDGLNRVIENGYPSQERILEEHHTRPGYAIVEEHHPGYAIVEEDIRGPHHVVEEHVQPAQHTVVEEHVHPGQHTVVEEHVHPGRQVIEEHLRHGYQVVEEQAVEEHLRPGYQFVDERIEHPGHSNQVVEEPVYHPHSTEEHLRPGCVVVENPSPAGYEVVEEHTRPGYELVEEHRRPGYKVVEEHRRPGYQVAEEHRRPDYVVVEEHRRPGYQVVEEQSRTGYQVVEEHVRPAYEVVQEEHIYPGHVFEEHVHRPHPVIEEHLHPGRQRVVDEFGREVIAGPRVVEEYSGHRHPRHRQPVQVSEEHVHPGHRVMEEHVVRPGREIVEEHVVRPRAASGRIEEHTVPGRVEERMPPRSPVTRVVPGRQVIPEHIISGRQANEEHVIPGRQIVQERVVSKPSPRVGPQRSAEERIPPAQRTIKEYGRQYVVERRPTEHIVEESRRPIEYIVEESRRPTEYVVEESHRPPAQHIYEERYEEPVPVRQEEPRYERPVYDRPVRVEEHRYQQPPVRIVEEHHPGYVDRHEHRQAPTRIVEHHFPREEVRYIEEPREEVRYVAEPREEVRYVEETVPGRYIREEYHAPRQIVQHSRPTFRSRTTETYADHSPPGGREIECYDDYPRDMRPISPAGSYETRSLEPRTYGESPREPATNEELLYAELLKQEKRRRRRKRLKKLERRRERIEGGHQDFDDIPQKNQQSASIPQGIPQGGVPLSNFTEPQQPLPSSGHRVHFGGAETYRTSHLSNGTIIHEPIGAGSTNTTALGVPTVLSPGLHPHLPPVHPINNVGMQQTSAVGMQQGPYSNIHGVGIAPIQGAYKTLDSSSSSDHSSKSPRKNKRSRSEERKSSKNRKGSKDRATSKERKRSKERKASKDRKQKKNTKELNLEQRRRKNESRAKESRSSESKQSKGRTEADELVENTFLANTSVANSNNSSNASGGYNMRGTTTEGGNSLANKKLIGPFIGPPPPGATIVSAY